MCFQVSSQCMGIWSIVFCSTKIFCLQARRLGGFGGFGRTPPPHCLERSTRWPTHKYFDQLKCLACVKKLLKPYENVTQVLQMDDCGKERIDDNFIIRTAFESRHDCKEVFKFLRLKASGLHKLANKNIIQLARYS